MPDLDVTAVMITGKSPERVPFALASIKAFQRQTYQRRRLVIINSAPTMLEYPQEPGDAPVYQFRAEPEKTLGALRNQALDAAYAMEPATHVIQWDDDDWSHERRIERQVAAAIMTPGAAITLYRQVRYSFGLKAAIVSVSQPFGIPGTILHPPTEQRYEEVPRHEDSRFMQRLLTVVPARRLSASMYIRFEHGANTWDQRHIMGRQAIHLAQLQRRRILLPEPDAAYLRQVLTEHYAWRT